MKEMLPKISKEIVREDLATSNAFKYAAIDKQHLKVLQQLVDVISKRQCITFENSWRTGKVPKTEAVQMVFPTSKR